VIGPTATVAKIPYPDFSDLDLISVYLLRNKSSHISMAHFSNIIIIYHGNTRREVVLNKIQHEKRLKF
jgi:hypothetical protein